MYGRMKKLLTLCLALLFVLGRGLCALPAPLKPTMSSVNFKHELHWTAAPGSPPGLTYHVYASLTKKWKEPVATSKTLWAEVTLNKTYGIYNLSVRSSLNKTHSRRSQAIQFTPYLDTNITAPNVTMSGCGKCIQVNISLPKPHRKSPIKDIREVYNLSYKVLWSKKGQEAVTSLKTKNQTVIIQGLLPHTEYCVQVKPDYLEVTFEPSARRCLFTSTEQPTQVFAVVGSVAGLVVFILSGLVLFLLILKYTGIICKLKEALPRTLITRLWQRSILKLERTVPDPVFLLPETGGQQHSHSDQDKEDGETDQVDQLEDQEEDQYMNRCTDLSSDSSCRCGHKTPSCQSAAAVSDDPGRPDEEIEEQKDEQAQIIEKEDLTKEESRDSKEGEEWLNELEKYQSVNLFSVTIAALDPQSDQEHCDMQPLLHTPDQSHIHQQLQESDTADQQSQMNYYMRH